MVFSSDPKARTDRKPGTVYAVAGEGGLVYYGQITPDGSIGFFRRRDLEVAEVEDVLSSPILAVVTVAYPSIGRALRAGLWKKLGRFELAKALLSPRPVVQWPVGALHVIVHHPGTRTAYETRVDDPSIQEFELMAVWAADEHIPARLTADFGLEPAEWHVGGPIWRERRVKEETARRFPDQPWHRLPPDWVPTGAS